MTSLFPTFGNLLQLAKRVLATDIIPVWQRFLDACDADERRYVEECQIKGIEFLL